VILASYSHNLQGFVIEGVERGSGLLEGGYGGEKKGQGERRGFIHSLSTGRNLNDLGPV